MAGTEGDVEDSSADTVYQISNYHTKYQYPDAMKRQCVYKSGCDATTVTSTLSGSSSGKFNIIDSSGACQECQKDQHPDVLARNCITNACPAFSILKSSGYCQECKDRYHTQDAAARTCQQVHCLSKFERLDEAGVCENCAAGFYPDGQKARTCEKRTCGDYEYLDSDG